MKSLSILYRGPLSSCNYDCGYCPFAKRRESAEELAVDERALARFVERCGELSHRRLGILFTPWGEALVRSWYWRAIARLSGMSHVEKVAVQTNLSGRLDWLADVERSKVALWCTYHPGETTRERFLARRARLDELGIRHSVGVVGLREHFDEIEALRGELPSDVYLWVNAFKDQPAYYLADEERRLAEIDPLFPINNQRHASLGKSCRAGTSVISVDGDGTIRRCHFLPQAIGDFHDPDFERRLDQELCTRATCGCHIGYVHLDELRLYDVFGDGVLERVPRSTRIVGCVEGRSVGRLG